MWEAVLVLEEEDESWEACWSRPAVVANCSKEHSFSLSTIHTTSSSTECANLWSASSDWAKHLWWFSFSHFFMMATGGRGGTATCSPCLNRGSLSHKTQPKNRNFVTVYYVTNRNCVIKIVHVHHVMQNMYIMGMRHVTVSWPGITRTGLLHKCSPELHLFLGWMRWLILRSP